MEAAGSMGVLTGNALALVMCLWEGRQLQDLHSLDISVLHLFFPKWRRPRAISSLHLYRTVKCLRVSPIKSSFKPDQKLLRTYSDSPHSILGLCWQTLNNNPVFALLTFTTPPIPPSTPRHLGQKLKCLQITGKALATNCGNHAR